MTKNDLYKIYDLLDKANIRFNVEGDEFEFDDRTDAIKGWNLIKKIAPNAELSGFNVKANS